MFTSMFPILSSRDLPRLLQFYVEALDAQETYRFPADGDAFFVSVDVAGQHLGIGFDPEAPAVEAKQRGALCFYAYSCDEAVELLRAAGATVVNEPSDTEWGERVAQVLDPDGNLLHVGQAASAG
ncbi:MAG: VOC family protein [Propionibacteriaceae bacterium]